MGCLVALLLAAVAGTFAHARGGSFDGVYWSVFLTAIAAPFAVRGLSSAARSELLARGGFPRFGAWWLRAVRDSWRKDGPTWTAISWGDRHYDSGSRTVHRVRVWTDGPPRGDASEWSTPDGEDVEGADDPLDVIHSSEIDRRLTAMRDAKWPDVHIPSMCNMGGTGRTPAIWVFPRRSRPRRRRADGLATGNPTTNARRAVERAGHHGCPVLVRLGVGIDDARLGDPEEKVRDAFGRHWPVEQWTASETERGLRWPDLGLAAAFDANDRCVLLRAAAPAEGHMIRGDTGESVCWFDFDTDESGGWTFETHFQLNRRWPTTRRGAGAVDVAEVGVRLLVDGGRAPTAQELEDQFTGSGERGQEFGDLRAIELRPPQVTNGA